MPDLIGTIVTDIGNKSLNALWLRASTIANNLANNDTPGYKAKAVAFEQQLSEALNGSTITDSQLAGINPVQYEIEGTYGANQNGVDIEDQFVQLTRNQLQYSYLERSINDNLNMVLSAARGGR